MSRKQVGQVSQSAYQARIAPFIVFHAIWHALHMQARSKLGFWNRFSQGWSSVVQRLQEATPLLLSLLDLDSTFAYCKRLSRTCACKDNHCACDVSCLTMCVPTAVIQHSIPAANDQQFTHPTQDTVCLALVTFLNWILSTKQHLIVFAVRSSV